MLIYVSSAKKLIKNSYFVAVGIWCGCIWVEIWEITKDVLTVQVSRERLLGAEIFEAWTEMFATNVVYGKKGVLCVRPLGGILGVVW